MYNQEFPLISHRNMSVANPTTKPSASKFDFLKHFLIVDVKNYLEYLLCK